MYWLLYQNCEKRLLSMIKQTQTILWFLTVVLSEITKSTALAICNSFIFVIIQYNQQEKITLETFFKRKVLIIKKHSC